VLFRSGHAKATRAGRAREPGPSVAVLPFSDMSPAKDQESFCDGIAEELISALTHIAGLRVAARASTFQFKGQARDVRQIGDALGVATVLDGSVRKDGDRLRITVELIGSADGYHLWSECFDRRLIDVFAIQHEIAAAVVSALRVRLTSKAGPIAPPRNTGVDVYELYLEGRYRWNKRTEDELTKSVGCFARAVERDPQFAPAYAGMADAYLTLGTYGALPPRDVMPRATDALERALALDPTSAEAYTCRGCLRSVYEWAWADAERDYLKAIALNPSYSTAHHWLAINHLVPLGRFDEATGALRVALTLDPLALAVRTSLGMKCYFAGQYDEAVRELSKTIELDAGFGMAHFFLGATYTELGAFDDASRELEAAVGLSGRSPELLAAVGYMYGRSGDATRARLVVKELEQLARSRYVSPAKIAQVLAGIDERDTALARLADAHREHAADLAWVAVRPVFQNLHNETGFVQLLQALQLADS